MLLEADRVGIAISNWLDTEVLPQCSGLRCVAVTAASTMISRHGADMINYASPVLKAVKILTPEGKVNGDEVIDTLCTMFKRMGKVSVGGLTYSEKDVQRLAEIMQSYAIPEETQYTAMPGNTGTNGSMNGNGNSILMNNGSNGVTR